MYEHSVSLSKDRAAEVWCAVLSSWRLSTDSLFPSQCLQNLVATKCRASLVVQMVKNPSAIQKTWVRSLGWEDLLEKRRVTHSSILAWKILWTEEPGSLQSMGSQRVRHNWATKHTHTSKGPFVCKLSSFQSYVIVVFVLVDFYAKKIPLCMSVFWEGTQVDCHLKLCVALVGIM